MYKSNRNFLTDINIKKEEDYEISSAELVLRHFKLTLRNTLELQISRLLHNE